MNINTYTYNIETYTYVDGTSRNKNQKTKRPASIYIIRRWIKGLVILIYIGSFLYFVIVEGHQLPKTKLQSVIQRFL